MGTDVGQDCFTHLPFSALLHCMANVSNLFV